MVFDSASLQRPLLWFPLLQRPLLQSPSQSRRRPLRWQRRADGDRQRRADYGDPTTEKWAQVVVGSDKDAGAEASERRDGVEEEEAVA